MSQLQFVKRVQECEEKEVQKRNTLPEDQRKTGEMMYKVKLFPSKCPSGYVWMMKYKDGDVRETSDNSYKYHIKHCCMEVLEHYKIVTVKKEKCPTCGNYVIKRKKVIL